MIKRYMDYKRRKELDKQARDMWIDLIHTGKYKEADVTEVLCFANEALTMFYDTFYPRIKS